MEHTKLDGIQMIEVKALLLADGWHEVLRNSCVMMLETKIFGEGERKAQGYAGSSRELLM